MILANHYCILIIIKYLTITDDWAFFPHIFQLAKAEEHYAQLVPTQIAALKRSSLELFDAREERDFLDKKLVLVLRAREEIIDRKEDLPEKMEIQLNIILQDYIEKRCELQNLKEEKSKLTQQQVYT